MRTGSNGRNAGRTNVTVQPAVLRSVATDGSAIRIYLVWSCTVFGSFPMTFSNAAMSALGASA